MGKRENQVTVDVGGELRRFMDQVKAREIDDPYAVPPKDADIVRDALPYALDAGEMALLMASRALRAENVSVWGGAMRRAQLACATWLIGR